MRTPTSLTRRAGPSVGVRAILLTRLVERLVGVCIMPLAISPTRLPAVGTTRAAAITQRVEAEAPIQPVAIIRRLAVVSSIPITGMWRLSLGEDTTSLTSRMGPLLVV